MSTLSGVSPALFVMMVSASSFRGVFSAKKHGGRGLVLGRSRKNSSDMVSQTLAAFHFGTIQDCYVVKSGI